MTPERRAEIEARVDRAVRRGELSQARADLVELLDAFPDDDRLRSRLEVFESAALPGELRPVRSAPAPADRASPAAGEPPEAPEVRAERLLQEGDLPGALLAYRQAVTDHPDNLLFRERLAELFEQVRQEAPPESTMDSSSLPDNETAAAPSATAPEAPTAAAAPDVTAAPSPEASAPPSPVPEASHPAAAPGAPAPAPTSDPGNDPVARLEQLLERLKARRRPL